MTELSDPDRLDVLMFDDNQALVSKAYFKIFQMLRTFDSMIQETHNDFRDWSFELLGSLKDYSLGDEDVGIPRALLEGEVNKVCDEWDEWVKRLNSRFGEMRGRFQEKQRDFITLTGIVSTFLFPLVSGALVLLFGVRGR